MAFGNVITDGTQVATGTYGYVCSFDLSAERIKEVTGVQLDDAGVLSSVEAAEDQNAVMNYIEDAACPDFAWYANGSTVYVFCKTSVYPYTSASRIAFYFYTNPAPIALTIDELIPGKMPAEAKELFKAITLQAVYNLTGARVPRELTNTIAKERGALGV